MLWLHCDVTGMMGKPLSFPGRPESQLSFHSCEKRWKHLYFLILRWNLWWSFAKLIQWCYMFSGPAESYVPLWSMRPTAWDLNSEPFPFMVFNFVLMIRILQCNVIMFHMWWLYIYIYYISDYMCADICSDILCSRQTNTFISLHISSICAHGSIIRWRRVWRVAQGDRDPALQGVLAVKNSGEFGGNWWKWLVTQCTCEDFGGIFGPICLVIQWFGYLWHHLQWSKVGMVPGYLWIFREATRVWGCDQPLHWTTWGISSSAGFFPELANGSKIDRTPEHLMAKAMVSCTLW